MKSMEPLKLILTERFRKSALELDPEIRAKTLASLTAS